MKQRILSLLLLLSVMLGAQAQLLWKVSGKELSQPSYVIGTYHMASTTFVDSIPGLKQALNNCQQVYGELDMISLASDATAALSMQQAMMLPEGTTIDSLLTPQQMERLNTFLKERIGTDLSNPALAPFKQMKPSAINTQLQLILCMSIEPQFNPNDLFDTYFQKEAQKQHKKVGGLETLTQQAHILFKQQSLARQTEQLMCLVDNTDYQIDLLKRTIQAFYAQDLKAIEAVTEEKQHTTCDSTPEEEEALIYGRNATWAKTLPTIMANGSTFVAVGAAHLVGPKGLLQLLRQAGYDVSPVK